jgi:hypothetical protein
LGMLDQSSIARVPAGITSSQEMPAPVLSSAGATTSGGKTSKVASVVIIRRYVSSAAEAAPRFWRCHEHHFVPVPTSLSMDWLDLVSSQKVGVLFLEAPDLRKADHVRKVIEGVQRGGDRLALSHGEIDARQGLTCSAQPDGGINRRSESHLVRL